MEELRMLDEVLFDWLPEATEDEIEEYFFDVD